MAGEKKKSSSEGKEKTEPAMPKPSLTDAKGVVLLFGYADETIRMHYVPIVTTLFGRFLDGDLAALKMIMELASKAGATEISDEEAETLGKLLMREFYGMQDGGSEGTGDGAVTIDVVGGVTVVDGDVEADGTADEGVVVVGQE